MYVVALATDYDGTLAEDGVVAKATLDALRLFKQSGRKLILVTGRELPDLRRVFADFELFDLAVVENGAVLVDPATGEEIPLGDESPPPFRRRAPASQCHAAIGWPQYRRDLGAERKDCPRHHPRPRAGVADRLQQGRRHGAPGRHQQGERAGGGAGAVAAVAAQCCRDRGCGERSRLSARLRLRGRGRKRLPMVKEDADLVASMPRGAGVAETIGRILDGDLAETASGIERQTIEFAHTSEGEPVRLHPQCGGTLIVGTSGGGKSTVATGLIEQIMERGFQFCIVDPEGDYDDLEGAVGLGDAKAPPRVPEVAELLGNPEQNVVINLLGIDVADRPSFLSELMPALSQLRVETARPHWLVIDEAHHLLPSAWHGAPLILPREFPANVLITIDPEHVAAEALQAVEYLVALGDEADHVVEAFCQMVGERAPPPFGRPLDRGQALFWSRRSRELRLVSTIQPRQERQRHSRKYAEGELGEDKSFYFQGPEGALNLRAQNLALFMQIAEGIDDRTWLHRLRAGDYSRWLKDKIKDSELADEVAAIESDQALSPSDSRLGVKKAIDRRYTSPA